MGFRPNFFPDFFICTYEIIFRFLVYSHFFTTIRFDGATAEMSRLIFVRTRLPV